MDLKEKASIKRERNRKRPGSDDHGLFFGPLEIEGDKK
jgi:hypothetical protein